MQILRAILGMLQASLNNKTSVVSFTCMILISEILINFNYQLLFSY